MQIILVHQRLAQARTIKLSPRHFLLFGTLFFLLVLAMSALLSWFTLTRADSGLPLVRQLLLSATQDESLRKDRYVRENLDAMAAKLGEMQAQLVRLEALGERVSGLAGLKPAEFNLGQPPGRGGPLVGEGRTLAMADFQTLLDGIARQLESRADWLNIAESELMNNKLRDKMMVTIQPVNVAYNASGFGWRIDPITGRSAMHEGIDFIAPTGSPIVAAAGGVVVAAEWHHAFGNLVEIDHGNEITTRYAHASRVYVRVGDIVKRGERIADVGTTGRSTGSHLHFEVLVRGIAQNPAKFLEGRGRADKATVSASAADTLRSR